MEKKIKFRIVNKNAKRALINVGGELKEVDWNRFNNLYDIETINNRSYAVPKKEVLQECERYDNLMNDLCIQTIIRNTSTSIAERLKSGYIIGTIATKIKGTWDLSDQQITAEARRRLKAIGYNFDKKPVTPMPYVESEEERKQREESKKNEEAKQQAYRTMHITVATESISNCKGADALRTLLKNED